ncbi:YafY family transcriptional regulator [Paenibacillus oralis]|uniref:YafY family transcriptional regulator n=1 Tax=Paenibacillus oralis TaxID=2490856 RepID=A0A3P3U6H0_9BACL|nr:YafY family protein [Paenibacillus oralis]RRJ65961.1 YafY family transcriptional regulator [Paenibacillus oralis]
MPKADNMLAVLWLLKSRGRVTAHQLAEELEVHVRTIYRCIDALCVSGVPIVSETGRDGGYYIPDRVKLEPLFFDAEEQKALVHAAAFAREAGYPFESALDRALSKIKRYATPDQLERLERHETRLEVIQQPSTASRIPVLTELELCIERQFSLEIIYRTGYDGSRTKRLMDPYGLVHWKGKWYVVGYCHLREEIRSFRVDRIGGLARIGNEFERPPHFSARDFLLDSLLPDSDPEPDGSSLVSVIIEGNPQALDDLCGHWLMGRALAERTEHRAHFRLDELNLYTQLPYYLLTFGGKIRIIEPEELRTCLVEITASLLDHHRS